MNEKERSFLFSALFDLKICMLLFGWLSPLAFSVARVFSSLLVALQPSGIVVLKEFWNWDILQR